MTKTVLTLVIQIPIKGENNMKKLKKKKNMSFFILVILSMLGTGRVNKDFSPGIFISKKW